MLGYVWGLLGVSWGGLGGSSERKKNEIAILGELRDFAGFGLSFRNFGVKHCTCVYLQRQQSRDVYGIVDNWSALSDPVRPASGYKAMGSTQYGTQGW